MKKSSPIIVVALLAIVAIAIIKLQKNEVEERDPTKVPKIDYGPLIRTHSDQAGRRNANAIQAFELAINRILKGHETKLTKVAEVAAKEGADYNSCCAIIYYLAWDKVKETSKTEDYLDSEINPIIEPVIADLVADVNTAVDTLESDLRRSTLVLAKDLAALGLPEKQRSIQVDIDGLSKADFKHSLGNLGFNAAGISVDLTFDAVAISQSRIGKLTWANIKFIALKMFGNQIGKVAGSAIAAAADGPLPVGDIIAIGGLMWTGYDVYASQKDFEKELKTSLSNLLLEANADIHKQAANHANSMLKEHQDFQDDIGSKTANDLSSPST
jgi:hypothetical protein